MRRSPQVRDDAHRMPVAPVTVSSSKFFLVFIIFSFFLSFSHLPLVLFLFLPILALHSYLFFCCSLPLMQLSATTALFLLIFCYSSSSPATAPSAPLLLVASATAFTTASTAFHLTLVSPLLFLPQLLVLSCFR